MDTVSVHLSLTRQAADLLEKYASKRTRGAFVSDLVVAHDLSEGDGEGMLEAMRKEVNAAQQLLSRRQNAYNKAREALQAGGNGTAAKPNRRR